ncbi:hypothetical protein QLX67_11505, partial [Balneolaceae bacterium ANBcel3]|nr:hypothetical protein [Balneolaceae bacterium ANBcel3]
MNIMENLTPPGQGLYDPSKEHDACGIGFVVNINGEQTRDIVKQALCVLRNLDHRGATGAEPNTGDGAGILMQIPHYFMKRSCEGLGFELPDPGNYGVGMVFLPEERDQRRFCELTIERVLKEEGLPLLGWRKVPTNNSSLGDTAVRVEPVVRQFFVKKPGSIETELDFERKLFIARRRSTLAIEKSNLGKAHKDFYYMNSLSSRTIVYKGMLTPNQVELYFPDLNDPDIRSAIALVHSRFSTNTFPSWKLAHPYRYIIHNGEINTVQGNQNWMHARGQQFASALFGDDIHKVLPIIQEDGSDSAKFDNCLEFLSLTGRSLAHSMMMMIPEPWERHETMNDDLKAFYQFHSCMMEPWDGPASVAFTDGKVVGANLDRNGLRPSRYYVTRSGMVVLASEVGVLEIEPEDVLYKERLQPGRMLLIDTTQGRIISDDEIKSEIAGEHPYRQWLDDNLVSFSKTASGISYENPDIRPEDILHRQKIFGYSYEDLRIN